jgi:hypothetical protein
MDDEVSVQVLQLATKVGHFKYMLEGRRRLYIGDFFDPSISRAQTCDLGLLGRAGSLKLLRRQNNAFGPQRRFHPVRQLGRFWGEADMKRQRERAASVESGRVGM